MDDVLLPAAIPGVAFDRSGQNRSYRAFMAPVYGTSGCHTKAAGERSLIVGMSSGRPSLLSPSYDGPRARAASQSSADDGRRSCDECHRIWHNCRPLSFVGLLNSDARFHIADYPL